MVNGENLCLKAHFSVLCVSEKEHTKDLFRINLHKTWCYSRVFYLFFSKKNIKAMMYDGTRCQQHCKTLFHVIGYYSHNIEATFRIKKMKIT